MKQELNSSFKKVLKSLQFNVVDAFLSYRYWAKAVTRSSPHLFLLPSLPHPPSAQHCLAPPPLLLAAVLPFGSPAKPRPASAHLRSPHPLLLPAYLLLLHAGWGVHSAPFPPRQAAARCSLWRSSSPSGLALKIPTARRVRFPLKVREACQGIKYIRKGGI